MNINISAIFSSFSDFFKAIFPSSETKQLFEANNIPTGCYKVNSITLSEQDTKYLWVIRLKKLSNIDGIGGEYMTYYSGKKPEIKYLSNDPNKTSPLYNVLTVNMQFEVVSTSEDQGRMHRFEPVS